MIIIPMMGRSSRFFDAGYRVPKYELELAGRPVLDWVLKSFVKEFSSETFMFVVRSDFQAKDFALSRATAMGIEQSVVLELDSETRGQADTVAVALSKVSRSVLEQSLTVFNADSFLIDFEMPRSAGQADGIIDVFEGDGDHWSFVEPSGGDRVRRTSEKHRISNLCSNGLYWFRTGELFLRGFEAMDSSGGFVNGELYIAPMFNYLLVQGADIRYRVVAKERCVFCGVPSEYEDLRQGHWSGF